MEDFNFDDWVELYKTDPVEFDRQRAAVLEAEILKAPPEYQDSLRQTQTKCNAISSSMPPLEATIQLSRLLMSKANELQDAFDKLNDAYAEYTHLKKTP